MSERRRLLMVAYHFPPLGGGGVQRTLKFAKHLPREGYEPIVLTTSARHYHVHDDTLAQDLPPTIQVLRAPELVVGRRAAGRARRAGLPYAPCFAGWPDREAGWIPGAVRTGMRAVRQLRPELIYSTAPPASAHVVALALHRLTGLPWVADFRDPWAHSVYHDRRPPGFAAADRLAERAVTRHARRVIVTSELTRLAGLSPDDDRRLVIPNGVDPDDVPAGLPGPDGRRFRLSFVGSLYRSIDLGPVLAALRRLAERGSVSPTEFELRVVGNVGVPELDAGPFEVIRTGYVDHAHAVGEMASAHALVCYMPPEAPQQTPGKIFEYLATGRPVLCVAARDNFAYRLVRDLDAGHCAEPHEHDRIESSIEALVAAWRAASLGPTGARDQVIARFSRGKLTHDLALALRSATATP